MTRTEGKANIVKAEQVLRNMGYDNLLVQKIRGSIWIQTSNMLPEKEISTALIAAGVKYMGIGYSCVFGLRPDL